MNAKQAREIVDREKGIKSLKKEDYIRLYIDDLLGQIKILSYSKEKEMLFVHPDKWVNEVRKELEKLEFVIEKRGKSEYIVW